MPGERCRGCRHVRHRDQCPRKGPSGCVPILDRATGEPNGTVCFTGKGPCPCPYGYCHTCGRDIVGASILPLYDGSPEIDIECGSADAPGGGWAVWQLPDGTLACRRLEPGEEPHRDEHRREWRGTEHTTCTAVASA
jgi:hypothetical protein